MRRRRVAASARRVERALPQVAELTGGAGRAEEDDLVLVFVGVALDEVRSPAARLRVGAASALDADELGGRPRCCRSKVAGWDRSGRDAELGLGRVTASARRMRTCVRDESGLGLGRFQRACDRGQVQQAEMAAREMGRLA